MKEIDCECSKCAIIFRATINFPCPKCREEQSKKFAEKWEEASEQYKKFMENIERREKNSTGWFYALKIFTIIAITFMLPSILIGYYVGSNELIFTCGFILGCFNYSLTKWLYEKIFERE